jgi:hypothetical protein
LSEEDRAFLRRWLQEAVGAKRAFIEEAKLAGTGDATLLEVRLRVPADESDRDIEEILAPAADGCDSILRDSAGAAPPRRLDAATTRCPAGLCGGSRPAIGSNAARPF